MQEVLMSADAKHILEDLGNLPKFKLPARIMGKGNLLQKGWWVYCSEVYSLPRVMKLAGVDAHGMPNVRAVQPP